MTFAVISARNVALPRNSTQLASRNTLARCMKPDQPQTDADTPVSKDVTKVMLDVPAQPTDTAVLGPVQELINGRAAMLGIFSAAISEIVTKQTVWSQIAGKYINGEVVEKAHGTSTLYFAAIVVVFTMASLAPTMFENQSPADREFGPFKASAEMVNGRAAMLGFAALLVIELFKQSPIF